MNEELQLRVHWPEASPALVYLPGLHGDWTLVGGFRRALDGRLCFVEITYPRTLDWSLDDYADAVRLALERNAIGRPWLLAESFGSQVAWSLIAREQAHVRGVILAGGFAQHPIRGAVRLSEWIGGRMPLSLLVRLMFGYAKLARFRHRHDQATRSGIDEFIARRTEQDRRAAVHRLRLVSQNDPRNIVQQTRVPVYALSGWLDPVVAWPFVRLWLRRNCTALRDYRIIWRADHNVLSTGSKACADQVLRWIRAQEDLTDPAV